MESLNNLNDIGIIKELHQELLEYVAQNTCGCNHPACSCCNNDKSANDLLDYIKERYKI